MKQPWQYLETKFNVLTERERGLIFLVVAALVVMLAYTFIDAQWQQLKQHKTHLANIEQQNLLSEQQIGLYNQRLAIDPNEDYRQRLTLINEQAQEIDANLKSQMIDMVPAQYMPTMLANLLANMHGVQLDSFSSIPPTPLLDIKENSDDKADHKLNLYSHGIKLSLTGDYFSILKFVKAIEDMPDKLFWEHLDYKVDSYPKGTMELEMYTLSINKDFIGVAN
ncbi:MSHA biogenesis protein MshJ [Shewanella intestini]|uniref:MSHA biogenesis protein MshJ n=1 Tax=Shewanella intestini TaxID=2017544 RepID=A0ABS5I6R4_9GAMM|nr:MSHA biogenesis protein MshJ [Shewanella sp. XMDDZSB0408]MBR9729070.1 MSHA biogenesis protein MshJ [Shewanella intestini]MRG37146.1 MSHA biogenesis protein MshJ [Shewanella sp. XMDDZSB0408]